MDSPWKKHLQKAGQQTRRAQNSRVDACFLRHQHDADAYTKCVEYNLEEIGKRHQMFLHRVLFGNKHLDLCLKDKPQEECQKTMKQYIKNSVKQYFKEMERF